MKLWEGNVFTLVCHYVHREVSLSKGGICPWVSLSGQSLSGGVSVQGSLSRGVTVQGVSVQGISVWGSLSGGSLSNSLCQGDLPIVKNKWYASY